MRSKADGEKAAGEFLEKLDKTGSKERDQVMRGLDLFIGVHGHKFTKEQLNAAMLKKWGAPKNRGKHAEPFTCCFSEAPGR